MLEYFKVNSVFYLIVFKHGYFHKDINGSILNLDRFTYKIKLNEGDIIGVEYTIFNHWNGSTKYLKLKSINLELYNADTCQSDYSKFTKIETHEIRNTLIDKIIE